MSQIISKFLNGGFFKYSKGVIENDRLIAAIGNNYQRYVQSLNWTNKLKTRFQNSVIKFIDGILDGSISEVSPTGVFYDKRSVENGGLSNDTGNKKFREDLEAAYFVNWVLNSQDPFLDYTTVKTISYNDVKTANDLQLELIRKREEARKKNEPAPIFDINKEFAKTFNKNVLHVDSDTLNPNSLRNIASSYKNNDVAYEIYYQLMNINPEVWGIYNDLQTYLNALKDSYNRFRNNESSEDPNKLDQQSLLYSELTKLGLDPSFLQYLNYAPKGMIADGTNQSVNAVENYLWDTQTLNWWNENKDKKLGLPQNSTNSSIFTEDFRGNLDAIGTYINNFFKNIPLEQYYDVVPANDTTWNIRTKNKSGQYVKLDITYSHIASNILNYLINTNTSNPDFVNKYLLKINQSNGNSGYAILPSINWNDKTIAVFNPNAKYGEFVGGSIKKVPLYFLTDDNLIGPIILNQLRNIGNGTVSRPNDKTFSWKEGGKLIKKHQGGSTIDYSLVNWNYNKRYLLKLNDDGTISLVERSNNATDNVAPGNGAYDIEPGGKEVENQSWYSNGWLNQLRNNSELAESWAKGYLNLQTPYKDKYLKLWFNDDGTFNFENFKTSLIPSDGYNGIGHDVYRGSIYRVKGTDQYGTLSDLQSKGYKLADNALPVSDSNNPLLDIYELDKSEDNNSNNIEENPTLPNISDEVKSKLTSGVTANHDEKEIKPRLYWLPDALRVVGSLGRFLNTNRTNKKIRDNELDAIRPVHTIPTRFERGIYGNYAATSTAAQNAAALNNMAVRPISSDPALLAARQLLALSQANDEIWKGVLKNQEAIKQTTEASLAQAKENMKSAVDAANANAKSEDDARRRRASVMSDYYKNQNTNAQNFSQELEKVALDWFERRKQVDQTLVNNYLEYNPIVQELSALLQDLSEHLQRGGTYNNWENKDRYLQLLNEQNKLKTTYPVIAEGQINGVGYDKNLLKQMTAEPLGKSEKIPQKYLDEYQQSINSWNQYISSNASTINDENTWNNALLNWEGYQDYQNLIKSIQQYVPNFQGTIKYVPSNAKGGTLSAKAKIKIEKMKNKLNRDKLFYTNLMNGIKLNKKSK